VPNETLAPKDAQSLASADVCIAKARKLARLAVSNIRRSLFFALVYNTAGGPVAAGILYPVSGAMLSPMLAAAAMSLSSVSVISNALRLRRLKF